MKHFDLIFVADPRFEGGSSTALALELVEAARMGLICALLIVRGSIIRHPLPSHPDIRAALENGLVQRLDPEESATARAVLVHHPGILTHALRPRPKILASRTVLVLHHPLHDAEGKQQYDLVRVVEHGRMAFGTNITLAPVSGVVRLGLPPSLPPGSALTERDWENLIDLSRWPMRGIRGRGDAVVLGRHARPDAKKWPDTAEEAFASLPVPEGWSVRILGGGDFLTRKYGHLPAKWHIEPYRAEGVANWLAGLDFWVFFHSSEWSEAFGRAVIEAMAVGVPVILHERMRSLFGDAATYCSPAEVEATIQDILEEDRWQTLSDRARDFVKKRHAANLFQPRILEILADLPWPEGMPPADGSQVTAPEILAPLPDRTVLFLSSNGIGMGHLTQQIAVANRLPPGLVPFFASMSYAISIARQAGYATEFIPHHRSGAVTPQAWNNHIAELVFELLTRLRPSVVVYDSTAPFEGILRALRQYGDTFSIWMRRAMWQEVHRPFLEALWSFDAVVEPGELAGELDAGPTRDQQGWVLSLPPVLHLDPHDRLSRKTAREILNLPEDAMAVSLQLGGGNNFPLGHLRERLIAEVLEQGAQIIEFLSPIRGGMADPPVAGPGHRQMRDFPQYRLSRAFDAAIGMAGYNSFHENLLGGLPTLFIPNEGPEMDMQVNRAIWAELAGCGLCLRRDHDSPRAEALIGRLLDPGEQARMRKAATQLPQGRNGAAILADFIEDHARLSRADRSHGIKI
ncbi:MAG: glycosyltransferase [Cypionkella sp.]